MNTWWQLCENPRPKPGASVLKSLKQSKFRSYAPGVFPICSNHVSPQSCVFRFCLAYTFTLLMVLVSQLCLSRVRYPNLLYHCVQWDAHYTHYNTRYSHVSSLTRNWSGLGWAMLHKTLLVVLGGVHKPWFNPLLPGSHLGWIPMNICSQLWWQWFVANLGPKKQNNYPVVANSCMWNKQPIFHPWDASNESNDVLRIFDSLATYCCYVWIWICIYIYMIHTYKYVIYI